MTTFTPGQRISVHNQKASIKTVEDREVEGEIVQVLTITPPIVYMSQVRHLVFSSEATLCEKVASV
jgi:hypothetical protein